MPTRPRPIVRRFHRPSARHRPIRAQPAAEGKGSLAIPRQPRPVALCVVLGAFALFQLALVVGAPLREFAWVGLTSGPSHAAVVPAGVAPGAGVEAVSAIDDDAPGGE